MSCYVPLARWYDRLTGDVPYEAFADFDEALFRADGGEFRLLLDLCCGTGTLTWRLAARGYEMIGCDRSVDMLMQARDKAVEGAAPPLFLCQSAEELDLYGTVDAAVCSLDALNYLEPGVLPEVFRRLHLFVRPGGLLVFDMRTPEFLRALDGQVPIPGRPALPASPDRLDYTGANAIEKFLAMTEDTLERIAGAWFYCDEVFAGEVDA